MIIYFCVGLILPHDYYGSHLDDNGKAIDKTLEVQNFKRARIFTRKDIPCMLHHRHSFYFEY